MNFHIQIERAFGERPLPSRLVEQKVPVTPEQQDALWFNYRDWRDVTWDDWDGHSDAFYAFVPEAFIYYLPSILSLSARHPDRWFAPADALLQILDRSPVVEYWDQFLTARLVGLKSNEYDTIKQWLLLLSESQGADDPDRIGRAFDTVNLLQQHTN